MFIELEMVPVSDRKNIEMSFVDKTAEAIVKLVSNVISDGHIYHVYNPKCISMRKLGECIVDTFENRNIEFVTSNEFVDKLSEIYSSKSYMKGLDKFYVYFGVMGEFTGVAALINCDFTLNVLQKIDFEWPEVTYKHVENVLKYGVGINFFEGGKNEK